MPSTFLQIVQTACAELGLTKPSVVIGSTDLQIIQLAALVNRDLRELQQNYDWTALQTEFDLYVAQPLSATGNLTLASETISNVVPSTSFSGLIITDPNLFLISGPSIPVNTRILTLTGSNPYTITIDQPSTGNATGAALSISQDTYPGPSDFDRYIPQTWWDRTNRWALLGPDSPQIDQWHRSGIVTIGPRRHFRQIGYNGLTQAGGAVNNYRIWPAPGATDTPINLTYEYISVNTVLSGTLVPQPSFQADTDFPILDENMMILGVKWRMWQIKGFDYSAMQQEYIDYCDRHYANDGGKKTLSMAKSRAGIYASLVQDGNFPGPTSSGF
jgi:hypothetical protein